MKNIETENRTRDDVTIVGIENQFIKWLIVAGNNEAAVRIAQKPEMLRTNVQLHNLAIATHYDPVVQNLYEVCPEYLDGEDEIAFYRKRVEHEQNQPWLNTLRALKIE